MDLVRLQAELSGKPGHVRSCHRCGATAAELERHAETRKWRCKSETGCKKRRQLRGSQAAG